MPFTCHSGISWPVRAVVSNALILCIIFLPIGCHVSRRLRGEKIPVVISPPFGVKKPFPGKIPGEIPDISVPNHSDMQRLYNVSSTIERQGKARLPFS
jgi:hypothetical protein